MLVLLSVVLCELRSECDHFGGRKRMHMLLPGLLVVIMKSGFIACSESDVKAFCFFVFFANLCSYSDCMAVGLANSYAMCSWVMRG